ncbi:class II histone deacetylase [Rhodalgimonas zhirmunskyi]|uniref:Class II histone deacetylase n=1 Tax=Rhodalgimonas zhirmunskyi TaxID=2964767 RepID=A0AAJ1UGH9_9RHOB|nr:class II histone deacetylase [Rhodoalgimonas zhirmunskyi]MDQ2095666.1 class II histone deacetylase [Rhodoalgimonas zhirmunskyi]
MTTGFFWDEKCFWHAGGAYALTLPIGDYVQPLAAGGLPENPETKRRLKNLMEVSGIVQDLEMQSAKPATWSDLARVHPESFLKKFKETSDAGGGELGLRTPFLKGGFEIAALSAGLAKEALAQVLEGTLDNAYSLSRPPGHHCLPDWPNGFCLLNNIAIAIEAAIAANQATRFAVVDWDVHHGNGTEAIFYDRDDVLTISIHQEHNYPLDTGDACDRGTGTGTGYNMNIPLPAGCGHETYLDVIDRIVTPALMEYAPDVIIVACGFDASAYDPIAQMLCSADTYRQMTARMMDTAAKLCDGKLVLVHEGGYSEAYVPFCGHAVMEQLSGSPHTAPDPMADTLSQRQPGPRARAFQQDLVTDLAKDLLGA